MKLRKCVLGVALWAGSAGTAGSVGATTREIVSEPSARKQLSVTAYRAGGQETAFLREIREVDIPAGKVRIALQGVSNTVQRETVAIRVIEGPPVEVLEQTYAYDILSPVSLLRAAEGSDITIDTVGLHDGNLRPVTARVVASGRGGTVVRTKEGYTFGLDGERRRMRSVPQRLTPQPTLTWHAHSAAAGKRKVEISYLMTGLRWSADYVATLSRNGRQLDLSGWVTFNNRTAGHFEDTNLALAAGVIHRANLPRSPRVITLSATAKSAPGYGANKAVREALGHLHLYKIPRPTTLEPNSIKNVRLLSLARVPFERRWVAGFYVQPSRHDRVRTKRSRLYLEMRNDKTANAGIPIPAGTVRVMAPDRRGTPHLVATSTVVDTPKGQKLKIDIGAVADVKARLVPKDYRTSLFGSKEATYELETRNGSTTAGVVRVELRPGPNTTLDIQAANVQRPDAATYRVEVRLGPGATKTLRVVATHSRPRR